MQKAIAKYNRFCFDIPSSELIPDWLLLSRASFRFSSMQTSEQKTIFTTCQKKQPRSHQQLKDIKIYLLTTSTDEAVKRKVLLVGAAGFFSKPPRIEDLKAILTGVLSPESPVVNLE